MWCSKITEHPDCGEKILTGCMNFSLNKIGRLLKEVGPSKLRGAKEFPQTGRTFTPQGTQIFHLGLVPQSICPSSILDSRGVRLPLIWCHRQVLLCHHPQALLRQ